MEIFWLCEQCDSTNNYEETKVCSVCGEKIDSKAEEKCIYEMAEQLYEKAVSSSDFFVACEYYLKVINYKDARQKHNECNFKAEKTLFNEKKYEEAKQHLLRAQEYGSSEKWDDAICEFTLAEQQFEKISHFLDSNQCANACRREIDLYQNKKIYFEAKKILSSATKIEEYQKAADLFSKIIQFVDAKENYDICLKFIKQLRAKQQLEDICREKRCADETSDLDKRISILQKIVNPKGLLLSEDAKSIVLQSQAILEDCLKQKKAIQTQRDLDEATKKYRDAMNLEVHSSRVQRLENILTDYTAYAQTAEFSQLFENCSKNITEANKHIDYNYAMDMMRSAVTSTDFQNAAEAFSRLSGFKDSDVKKDECNEKVKVLLEEATYKTALETYEKGEKITIFNWKKYV